MTELTNEELQQKVAENRELEKQLTKKNNQFMFDLNKLLDDGVVIDERQKIEALNTMLKALVEGQKTGITAKQLYGTPTEAVVFVTTKPATPPKTNFASMWLDNSLLLFTFLAVMTGVLTMISKTPQPTQGILSIIIGAMSGGLSFYLIYRYIYIYDMPGADKSKRPGVWKTGGIMALCFIPWLMIFSLSAFIPRAINPSLDPVITIVLGAAAFGVRYLLKKKYNIQGSLFLRP
ncbi:DUF1129 domain-containing protein [Vagococcus luciliae]|uniref:DUF1129 domain-containing protein n=1 Tax=Vagococcus luciliae TaxID=2920380 RepID=A0ABY5NXV5_9ENTE|nr:DUF1129 domain-containing protein [Vagococcus luciliae]UUV98412.1 hypothetical protein G314FT_05280 [Vagococcus luciliae]